MSMLREVSKYNLSFDKNFLRKLKKYYKKDKALYIRVKIFLKSFVNDPFYSGFKSHRVFVSNHRKVYASRVTGDIRVIWSLEDDYIILLLDIGGHEGSKKVYK